MEIKECSRIFRDDPGFPLNVRFIEQEPHILHGHEFTELIIIISGRGVHLTPFDAVPLEPGCVMVIPRGGSHGYRDVAELKLMNVLFDADRLPMPLLDFHQLPGFNALFALRNEFCLQNRFYPFFRLQPEHRDQVSLLLNFMEQECAAMRPGHRLALLGYFMSLLAVLARAYDERLPELHAVPGGIATVMSFMKNNYTRTLILDEIVRVAGMSKSSFMRSFRQATGTSPIDYLLRTRIMAACALLRSPRYRIAEIADRVGFADSDYFARAFRKITGKSPRLYRNENLR